MRSCREGLGAPSQARERAGEAPRGKAREGNGQLDCGEETTPEAPLQREAGFAPEASGRRRGPRAQFHGNSGGMVVESSDGKYYGSSFGGQVVFLLA